MAELASGAVTALLGVIRNEQRLLGGVKGDVQFIKEEMESMNSFLLHLSRTAPPGGEHDEQVRTWMSQVRQLAQDCNSCIDLYLYRGNPDIHLARRGLRRNLWLVPWFVQKMVAQHFAAVQLRELKERAREVGERRLRYGVEVPSKKASGQSPAPGSSRARPTAARLLPAHEEAPAEDGREDDEDEDSDDELLAATTATHPSGPREALFKLRGLEEHFNGKLGDWIKKVAQPTAGATASTMPSIAIIVPDPKDAQALATQALSAAKAHLQRSVLVDIPAVHSSFVLLEPEDVLCYIWRELELESTGQGQGKEQQHIHWRKKRKWGIYFERRAAIREIREIIKEMNFHEKFESIKSEIREVKDNQLQLALELEKTQSKRVIKDMINNASLGVLLLLLKSAADEQDRVKTKAMPTLAEFYDDIIKKTAKEIEAHMKVEKEADTKRLRRIVLNNAHKQYEHILKEVFSKTSNSKPLQVEDQQDRSTTNNKVRMTAGTSTIGEDHIKSMINKAKEEILQQLQAEKYENKNGAGKRGSHVQIHEGGTSQPVAVQDQMIQIPNEDIKETIEKIGEIKREIEKLMENKGIVDKITNYLKDDDRILIILKTDQNYALGWEETRHALNLLNCVAGAVIVTVSEDNQRAKEYCSPGEDPMEYSLVGFYHDIVLELTRHKMNEDNYYDNLPIFRLILDKCHTHEFCMKIFAHALYVNPKRSNKELSKLKKILQSSPTSLGSIAQKMIKFSYNDLPKDYKSCLLYLAIFPQGVKIRRSTLIGRWVAEGLITTDDWRWSSSVRQAGRCFDALLNRWLIEPADTSAVGKVKSCKVRDLVHQFITKIAKKQHILETRLSHHLAQHFSIFNNLHLRVSDTIDTFFQKIQETSQFSQLKVLDLEGCQVFHGNKRYLKDICCNILLLKYLSLRATDVTQLPSEINNLHELEVLDIRQTKVPEFATRHIRLLKLKRLLAGHTDSTTSSVQIPDKVEKMLDMEVLSKIKPKTSQDLKDIGNLWQLRKLGVVFENKDINVFLEAIGNLHRNLRSLSVTLVTMNRCEGTSSSKRTLSSANDDYRLSYPPQFLESLSISGIRQRVHLLGLLSTDGKSDRLAKVTLTGTSLIEEDLKVLGMLSRLQCVRFQHVECTDSVLTFKEGEFNNLKYLLVEGSNFTDIIFEKGAACALEKMLLSFTNIGYISRVDGLLKLEELELNHNRCGRLLSSFDSARQIAKLTLRGTLLDNVDLQMLAKKPNIHSLLLLEGSCDVSQSQITFNKDDFPKLTHLIVDCPTIAKIIFASGSAPKLEKIVLLSSTSLSDIDNLPRLKELQFRGYPNPDELKEATKKHRNKPKFKPI